MSSAKIYFSDGSSVIVNEKNIISPVYPIDKDGQKYSTKDCPKELYSHIHGGLVTSLLDVLCFCPFFYIDENLSVVYSSNSIVRIENI